MAEENKRKFDIPWVTLLPVMAALAGVVAQFRPLVSARPGVPGEKSIPVIADQDVDARLWQDPIAVAQKEHAEITADVATGHPSRHHLGKHNLNELGALLHKEAQNVAGQILLLGVMIDAGPYIEQSEGRLRARRAVLEGLSESGFVPVDAEHIGFVTMNWPPVAPYLTDTGVPASDLLIPWEECRAIDSVQTIYPAGTDRIVILWLPAADFNPYPLGRFAALIDAIIGDLRNRVNVKLMGPANSTGLQAMVREVRTWTAQLPTKRDTLLDGVSIISSRATASAEALLYNLPPNETQQTQPDTVEGRIEAAVRPGPGNGLRFIRTIATDDVVLNTLQAELKKRQIHISPSEDHVVILSEWDTTYGRSLATTFAAALTSQTIPQVLMTKLEDTFAIHSYRYMHGIDGRLPGDRDNSGAGQSKKTDSAQQPAVEATDGLDQSDFLRRLASQLKQDDSLRVRKGEGRIAAIGLLGSDVYDKLMILRALRPEFPGAVFFTNNFDAHFARLDAWDDAHNLVVASPFGGSLPAQWQRHFAPYRDSTQTSMFAGTLVATGVISEGEIKQLTTEPRLFEIGRQGAYELLTGTPMIGPRDGIRDPYWFRRWLASPRVATSLGVAIIAGALLAHWMSRNVSRRRRANEHEIINRARCMARNTTLWMICTAPPIILLVSLYAQTPAGAEEPLAFFGGVSVWPSEIVRLIAFVLAVHFMIKASIDLRINQAEIAEEYSLESPRRTSRWKAFLKGMTPWEYAHKTWLLPDARFTAGEAWQAYVVRNQFWPRFLRISVLFVLYVVFLAGLLGSFTRSPASTPARGEAAFHFDTLVLGFSALGMMILTFYVVDAIKLTSNFIRVFTRGVTTWAPAVSTRSGRVPPLAEEELSRYHDITFVAERTEVVARLIWYPLIVLALMLFARSSRFDHWTWPPNLIVVFSFYAAWTLGSAAFLRRAAEQLRETALENLRKLRLINYKDPEKQKAFDEMMSELRGLKKGAFAPLSEQPFIRAIVFPSGGLGLLAVAQRLLESF
jgi:hypothetical protein